MNTEEVARRYARRPGFRLANYREVGLPLWLINLRCLTLAHRPLPPLQEFALKAVGAELTTLPRIRDFLGLEDAHVIATVADLVTRDYVVPVSGDSTDETTFALTTLGRHTLQEVTELASEQRVYPLHYDGLTRQFVRLGNIPMYSKAELRGEGIDEVPAFPNEPPEVQDFSVAEIGKLLNEIASPLEVRRDLISVVAIEGNRRRLFQRAVALVYESVTDGSVSVAFSIDGRLSDEHAAAFAQAEGARKMGIVRTLRRSAADVAATLLPKDVIAAAPAAEEVQALRQATDSLKEVVEDLERRVTSAQDGPEREALKQQINETTHRLATTEAALEQLPARSLEVYEHAPLLRDAFDQASTRLMIVSPWIRAAVVNREFIQRLEATLKRGVVVYIGYGSGADEGAMNRDQEAERQLAMISEQYGNFVFGRVGDTHAKVLLVDDKYVVVTSFNWLSFKGDPQMPFRDERGMLVTIRETVDQIFGSFEGRIRTAAIKQHPSPSG